MAEETKKKGNIFRSIRKFFREVRIELKKVTWPTKHQMTRNTVIVLIFLAVVVLLVFGFDLLFQLLYSKLF